MNRLLLISSLLLLVTCSADRNAGSLFGPSEAGTPVIDSYLIVDRPMPDLFVRKTLAPSAVYSHAAAAVHRARVTVIQGGVEYLYADAGDTLGRYTPPAGAPTIQPETDYNLLVQIGDQDVTAVTRTPKRVQLDENVLLDATTLQVVRRLKSFRNDPDSVFTALVNQVHYQENLLETRFQPIGASGYQVGVRNLETNSAFLVEADFLSDDDLKEFKRYSSSPPFEAPDGRLRLPWFAIYYAGRHVLRIYAMDANWFDYTRTGPAQPNGGFGNLAGDSFERPVFHIQGGIGLFGSASVDSLGFVVLPKAAN